MKLPKRGQKGFTLIELLIVVAILGVLAAVVIPNIAQFIGAGTEEAIDTEFATIQAVVHSMMVDNKIATINPVVDTTAINDMNAFPDITATLLSKGADATFVGLSGVTEVLGYLLYGTQIVIDINGNGIYDSGDDDIKAVNYAATQTTAYYYTVDASGTVKQWDGANTATATQLN